MINDHTTFATNYAIRVSRHGLDRGGEVGGGGGVGTGFAAGVQIAMMVELLTLVVLPAAGAVVM